jgi:hypothetical protein
MMEARKTFVSSLKTASIFFGVALILNLFVELQNAGWDYTAVKLRVEPYTLLVPLMVFAWQMISEFQAERLRHETQELTGRLMTIPDEVRQGTRQEVNRLKEDNEEFRRQLARGVVEHDQHYYRTLTYKREEGTLFNGFGDAKDISRNVLFSNKTVNLILREIRDLDRSKPRLLHDIGKKASERFAAEMVKDIQAQTRTTFKSDTERLPEWIKKWIEFDSDAGFGKFELEGTEAEWKNHKVIVLKYSFLTQDCLEDRKRNFELCFFMTGYLEGILNSFPKDVLSPYDLYPGEISVEHNPNDSDECICAGRADFKGCRFQLVSSSRKK